MESRILFQVPVTKFQPFNFLTFFIMNTECHLLRLYSRIGLLFIHKKGDFGSISVTQQSCAGHISKVDSHILDRCSYYSGQFLFQHENHNGQGFCTFTHEKGEFGLIYVTQQKLGRVHSLESGVSHIYWIGVHAIVDSLNLCRMKTLTGRASIHTKER